MDMIRSASEFRRIKHAVLVAIVIGGGSAAQAQDPALQSPG